MIYAALICLSLGDIPCVQGEPWQFLPGDADRSGALNATDATTILNYLYYGTSANLEASDVNGDEDVNNSDPVYLLNYLYQGGPPPFLGTGLVASCQQFYQEVFGSIASMRLLTDGERAALAAEPRFVALKNVLWTKAGYTYHLPSATLLHIVYPDGASVDMIDVPVGSGSGIKGGMFFHKGGGLAMAITTGAPGPHLFAWGASGGKVSLDFRSSDAKYLGFTDLEAGQGGAFTQLWEDFKNWLSSDSPAEDVPWWVDLICSLGVLSSFTNPVSGSVTIHCLGIYVAACVRVPSPA